MNDVLKPRGGEEGRGEETDQVEESSFEQNREAMISYLKDEMRRIKNRAVADDAGRRRNDERIDFLTRIISALQQEGGDLSAPREYFEERKASKEKDVEGAAKFLRREIEETDPKIDELQREKDDLTLKLTKAAQGKDTGRMRDIKDQIGIVDNGIAGLRLGVSQVQHSLEMAQNDLDLAQFERFLAMIDEEMKRRAEGAAENLT